jgi:hypothetical protein
VAKKARGAKWHAPVLNTLERFLERMRDEPKHAAHFAQKIACDLTDFLSNDNGGMSVRHLGEVASVRDVEKDKVNGLGVNL